MFKLKQVDIMTAETLQLNLSVVNARLYNKRLKQFHYTTLFAMHDQAEQNNDLGMFLISRHSVWHGWSVLLLIKTRRTTTNPIRPI